ncbi:hypothetical protein ACLOJK_027491 [Asimina triloba]
MLQGDGIRSSAVAEYLRSVAYHRQIEFEQAHDSQSGYIRALFDLAALYPEKRPARYPQSRDHRSTVHPPSARGDWTPLPSSLTTTRWDDHRCSGRAPHKPCGSDHPASIGRRKPHHEGRVQRSRQSIESPPTTALALITAATRLTRALRYTPVRAFDDLDIVAPNGTPSGRKCASTADRLPPDLGGTTLCLRRRRKHLDGRFDQGCHDTRWSTCLMLCP